MNELKIYNLNDAINVVKEDLTAVNYYLFDEYEIHLNVLPPHTIQPWHFHRQIEEVIVVIKGKMQCLPIYAFHRIKLFIKIQAQSFRSHLWYQLCNFSVHGIVHDQIGKQRRAIIKNRAIMKFTQIITQYRNIVGMPILVKKQRIYGEQPAKIRAKIFQSCHLLYLLHRF